MVKHEGKLFVCPKEDCKLQLSSMSNLKRHVKRHGERGESWQSLNLQSREVKNYPCPKPCCGKVFKSPSRLVKHLDDVHSTTYVQVVCCEPGCLKYFTNAEALREHVQQNHSRICCEVCGSQQLKKQIKRHMRIHESQTCVERIKCHFDNCLHSFTRKSNLNQHIRAVHLGLRPFKCRFHECEMSFSHKAVRDNHEKTGRHCYVQGDFLEEDAAFQSRPRGGRKRKMFTINTLLKKRVACPDRSSTVLDNGSSFLDWLTSSSRE
jgi:general transcription factor IIIA